MRISAHDRTCKDVNYFCFNVTYALCYNDGYDMSYEENCSDISSDVGIIYYNITVN